MSPLTTRTGGGGYGRYLTNASRIADLLMLNLAYFLTLQIYGHNQLLGSRTVWLLLNLVFVVVILWITRSGYNRSATVERLLNLTVREVMLHAMIFVPGLYFLEIDNIPWQDFVVFYTMALIGLMGLRMVVKALLRYVRRKGYNYSSVVIVGSGPQAERLYRQMRSHDGYGYRISAVFGIKPPEGSELSRSYMGEVRELENFLDSNPVDEIYYCTNRPVSTDIAYVARECEARMLQFFFVPQIPSKVLGRFHVSSLGSVPVLTLKETPLKSVINRAIKRSFDILFSLVALLFFFIFVYVPVAISIKRSSPGPVYFKQKRTGLMGREFWCYKFRTMKVNADSDKAQATRDDPRKTKVGDFLRRTSIDELPQFINVLRGDMSVVGPRPHMLKHTKEYAELIDQYMVRHAVRPGITGWAQVNGYRGQTDELWQMEGRVEHDIWYIEHWSFLLDLRIIVQTVINAVRGEDNAF